MRSSTTLFCIDTHLPSRTIVNQAFEFFVNLNNRSPEYISLFIDDRLRKGIKGMSDGDIDIVLDKVMCIFRCAPVSLSRVP